MVVYDTKLKALWMITCNTTRFGCEPNESLFHTCLMSLNQIDETKMIRKCIIKLNDECANN